MATLTDIGLAAAINILSAIAFLIAFAVLRLQPINDRVYFPKWYLKGVRGSPTRSGTFVHKFVNLNLRSYLRFLEWMPAALRMPEPELIDHAGLDSAVYLRIYLIGLKLFVPMAILSFAILVPVNWTNSGTLENSKVEYSDIDKLSISNIPSGSQRFWAHLVVAYAFTFWTCYVLLKEYEIVASMRLHFLASEKRRPDQFTVLVRNVPPDPDESVSELVEHFFVVNHRDHYLTHQVVCNANKLAKLVKTKKQMQNWHDYYQLKYDRDPSKRPTRKTGFLGLCGDEVDAIEFYTSKIDELSEKEATEREMIKNNSKSIMPAAFVSFRTRWGAAVCAQTQQTQNPTLWLTEWAPEPRDVYWQNLAIPFVSLTVRRLIVAVAVFFLTFFFMIPIAFVQSLANIEGIEKVVPFLKPIIEEIPKTIGVSIPQKATFFITYVMVDGWAGIAGEILRLKPLIIYHLKNFFLVKTEKDREEAMDPGSIDFASSEPQIQLYFLLGLVYAVVTPFLLPFIIIFFALAYAVFRHQIINVYNQEYESGAAFWPDVHGRIITALIISQLLLLGLLSTKHAANSTPLLLVLPVLTISFHRFCKNRYEPAFVKYPLQEAMMKDTLEHATEPNLDLRAYLLNAYVHPLFKDEDDDDSFSGGGEQEYETKLVPTKRQSRKNTPVPSKYNGSSSPSLPEIVKEQL
ncbi:calcium permeable stress-gated cation channel 1-like isoform X2 [Musa acuminata AAA Group]|uniref:calcium permeable stress-gated cation channel 1-like isoform X2 n=1 Tax=Musa acuminata AAA Group TaxID=214697 RepID=UPI0031DAA594